MQITIDKEFKELIPPLSDEELEQLETNIIGDGIREPLVTWNGILIDGHHRYEIAEEHGIKFETVEMDFGSREEARIWIIQNQLGRRNLSMWDRSKLVLLLKPEIKGRTPNVRGELAELANVSENTIQRADYLTSHASEEVLEKLDSGEISINKAYNEVREPSSTPTFGDIKGNAEEIRREILLRIPEKDGRIGLPFQMAATSAIRSLIAGDTDDAVKKVLELLEEPTPATMALARIILNAV